MSRTSSSTTAATSAARPTGSGGSTDLHVQGFFVYDSKKSGAITVSHLRFGPVRFEAPYLIQQAGFVAVQGAAANKHQAITQVGR